MSSAASAATVLGPYAAHHGRVLSVPLERTLPRWHIAVGVLAVGLAGLALWMTLRADFLAHPEWLAVQKADFILGPVLTGLYWMHRRPESRFGPMLIEVRQGRAYVNEEAVEPAEPPAGAPSPTCGRGPG